MAKQKTRLVGTFFAAGGDVNLRAFIGDRQDGAVTVAVDAREVAPSGDVYRLGPGSELEGKTVIVGASVTDTNPSTNKTSLTVRMSDDLTSDEYRLSRDAKEGEQVQYAMILHVD